MDPKTYLYTLAIIAGSLAGIGDSMLDLWVKNPRNTLYLIGGFIIFNVSLIVFIGMLKIGLLNQSVILFIVANVLLVFIASFVLFKESFSTQKFFWAIIALVAVIMMETSKT